MGSDEKVKRVIELHKALCCYLSIDNDLIQGQVRFLMDQVLVPYIDPSNL